MAQQLEPQGVSTGRQRLMSIPANREEKPFVDPDATPGNIYKYTPKIDSTSVHCNIPDDEISEAELCTIENRMYPGEFCREGFLKREMFHGSDRLATVIKTDNDYLQSVSITHKQIADTLGSIVDCCNQYYVQYGLILEDPPLIVDNKFIFKRVQWMGAQICPYWNKTVDPKYHGNEYGDTDVTITNSLTKEKITFNTLLIHMISQHRFFESPNCEHRLDPAIVIKMFDLKPGIEPPNEHLISMGGIDPVEYRKYRQLLRFEQDNLIYAGAFAKRL